MKQAKKAPTTIPHLPGVYFFKNSANQIIYIGKAKSLKKRVNSYFQNYLKDWKIDALLNEHTTIDYIITGTEAEALLLEAQLIQEHKPKFNALLKDGNPFVYIMFDKNPLPELKIVRTKQIKGTYFGPFIHKQHARRVIRFLEQTFRLMQCKKTIPNGCLAYHIGQCAGTCRADFNPNDYLFRIELAKNVLSKDRATFIEKIKDKIKCYSAELEYEKARTLQQYLHNIEIIFAILKTEFSPIKYVDQITSTTIAHNFLEQVSTDLAQQLQVLLKVEKPIHTIDCFDISHFQSKEIVGSCIRFIDGIPQKNMFRRFKVQGMEEQNDYAALQQIISRRYKNDPLPDLLLIDGGKGQLSAAQAIFPNAQVASLAKRLEQLFFKNLPNNGLILNPKNPTERTLLALRDYAHHFAITYHRLRRRKTVINE
jgi:excinuclease ABC subunit C